MSDDAAPQTPAFARFMAWANRRFGNLPRWDGTDDVFLAVETEYEALAAVVASHPIPARGETTPTDESPTTKDVAVAKALLTPGAAGFRALAAAMNAPDPSLPVEPAGTPEALAQRFHEAYERLAPSFGYETRKASAKPWAEVPENNRRLMTAVCAEVCAALTSEVSALREAVDRAKATDVGYTTKGQPQEPEPVIQPSRADLVPFWRSASCNGERCTLCGAPADLKVGEEIMHDDPHQMRHNLTAYVCLTCGNRLFFPYLFRRVETT